MSAHVTSLSAKSWSIELNFSMCLRTIFFSMLREANFWSTEIVNLSRNASSMIDAAVNLPSSEPLPLVLAVAITLNPGAGDTISPVFLTKTGFPSNMPCKHMILFVALSISSSNNIAPFSIAFKTGPFEKTVSPLINLNPPIKSSSSVSGLICTLINSVLSLAHACSTIKVLPFPERPEMYVG